MWKYDRWQELSKFNFFGKIFNPNFYPNESDKQNRIELEIFIFQETLCPCFGILSNKMTIPYLSPPSLHDYCLNHLVVCNNYSVFYFRWSYKLNSYYKWLHCWVSNYLNLPECFDKFAKRFGTFPSVEVFGGKYINPISNGEFDIFVVGVQRDSQVCDARRRTSSVLEVCTIATERHFPANWVSPPRTTASDSITGPIK